ncbi:MAG TPA: deoxyguanosinetriphosphate triphosphohydrolase [Anaerolineales bacterium]|nr:deoxyguanosinetriphosphate triphosphohydrolase [Anaerolineales bacterium]
MIFSRDLLEEREALNLAPYGLKSRDSRGRAYGPDPEPEDRTAFQRDRDRILHTTAFRRLEYKTQVFVNYEGDYYRTRLTHTLEVAQIGRTIARALGANEDLVEAICLAHDLGHPPFGHSGEATLNRLMDKHGGFDHNRQSFRIVTELEHRYPNWLGLNLTWETREGIVKHETEYDVADAHDFDPDKRGHLEAQIANIADEMAYTAHDLDDGLRSGLLAFGDLANLALVRRLRASLSLPLDTVLLRAGQIDDLTRHRVIRRLIGIEVDDLVQATHARLAAASVESVEAVQRLPHNVIGASEPLAVENREMKQYLFQNMYRHYRVARMEAKADRVLSELFTAYINRPEQLPPSVRERAEQTLTLQRAVCDYLAGMTDRFALDEHARLFDPYVRP